MYYPFAVSITVKIKYTLTIKRFSLFHSVCLFNTNFSQLYVKASFPDIGSIPIQANKARQIMGIFFQFNNTVIKIDRELNTRRNTRFIGKSDKMEQNNDVTLISPPTSPQCQMICILEYSGLEVT